MQPQSRPMASKYRLLLFIFWFFRRCALGYGVYAYELPVKSSHILSVPLHWREGEWRSSQMIYNRGIVTPRMRTLHALARISLDREEDAGGEAAVHERRDRVKEEHGSKDHRKLGTMMDLFCFPKPKVGAMSGLGPALLPRGLCCMLQLQQALRNIQAGQGFEEVRTGSLAQAHLWRRSGHMQHFADNMFEIANRREGASDLRSGEMPNVAMSEREESLATFADDAGASYLLKPMSCPLHLSYFFDRSDSEGEGMRFWLKRFLTQVRLGYPLPLRISEFGHVYRREVPSALCGLMRLREFTQDDGHILCRMSQALAEVTAFLSACQRLYRALGFSKGEIVYHISTRPKSSQGSEDEWASAEELLRSALEQHRISFMVASGEGAFYGPKIDIHLPDGEGRLWQTGTLQVDLVSPRNFGLEPTATNSDRVCFLHRAMCGSLERFFGLVLEHLDGHLPLWLAPTQVALLTVGEGQAISAEAISRRLRRAKIRVSLDTRPVHISKKLKLHINYRTPEVWILGRTDQERNTVTVRRPHGKQAAAPVERALASVRRRAKIPF